VNTVYLIYYKLCFELLFELKRARLIRIILVRGLVHISFLSHQENATVVHLRGHFTYRTVCILFGHFA